MRLHCCKDILTALLYSSSPSSEVPGVDQLDYICSHPKHIRCIDSSFDIKNLMKIIQTLKDKLNKIDEDRKFTSRTAGKIETMFSDMSSKLGEFQGYKDKISFNEETMHEIMKTMDLIETRMGGLVKKDDLKKLETLVEEKFQQLLMEQKSRAKQGR